MTTEMPEVIYASTGLTEDAAYGGWFATEATLGKDFAYARIPKDIEPGQHAVINKKRLPHLRNVEDSALIARTAAHRKLIEALSNIPDSAFSQMKMKDGMVLFHESVCTVKALAAQQLKELNDAE